MKRIVVTMLLIFTLYGCEGCPETSCGICRNPCAYGGLGY